MLRLLTSFLRSSTVCIVSCNLPQLISLFLITPKVTSHGVLSFSCVSRIVYTPPKEMFRFDFFKQTKKVNLESFVCSVSIGTSNFFKTNLGYFNITIPSFKLVYYISLAIVSIGYSFHGNLVFSDTNYFHNFPSTATWHSKRVRDCKIRMLGFESQDGQFVSDFREMKPLQVFSGSVRLFKKVLLLPLLFEKSMFRLQEKAVFESQVYLFGYF